MAGNVADQVMAIIAAQALRPVESIRPSDSLEAVGLDSLGMVETIFAIEEAFDISVPFNPNEADATSIAGIEILDVAGLITAIVALIAQKSE